MVLTKTRLTVACALALTMTTAFADFATDADTILNWGEANYAPLLPTHEITQQLDPWYFRYYPKTNLYVGINSGDNGVYSLYGEPGSAPIYIDSAANILSQIALANQPPVVTPPVTPPPVQNEQSGCNVANAPQGVAYNENGNNTKITTNGQCITFPRNDICLPKSPLSGGISVVKEMHIQTYSLSGIVFASPSLAQKLEPQIKSAGNIKSCVKNAPPAFANVNLDIQGCFDVSDRVKDFPAIQNLIKISPPVTMQLQGTVASQTVSDCFQTDATIITDAITNEVWDKKDNGFVKR